jgi:hypothetical protein
MSALRLLPLVLLIAAAAAQSTSDKNPDSSQRSAARENEPLVPSPLDSHSPHIIPLEQNQATCYTLRTYRVARENPDSDSTRPAGYSTCQRAARFQLRTAVDSRELAPR